MNMEFGIGMLAGQHIGKGELPFCRRSLEQWTCQTASTEWTLNLYTFEIHTKVPHDCFDNYFLFFYENYDCQGMLPLLRQSDIFKQREAAMQLSIYTIRFTISWSFSTCPFLLREDINWKKKRFLSGIARLMEGGGEGLPMPEFFGPLFRSAFLVNKESLFLQKCQCIELLTVF